MNEETTSLAESLLASISSAARGRVKCNRKLGEMGEVGMGIEMHSDPDEQTSEQTWTAAAVHRTPTVYNLQSALQLRKRATSKSYFVLQNGLLLLLLT